MSSWYVCYKRGRVNVMQPAADKAGALDIACNLLGRGFNVLEAGPMIDYGAKVGGAEIRRLRRKRDAASSGGAQFSLLDWTHG